MRAPQRGCETAFAWTLVAAGVVWLGMLGYFVYRAANG